jgi:hypothetical protein
MVLKRAIIDLVFNGFGGIELELLDIQQTFNNEQYKDIVHHVEMTGAKLEHFKFKLILDKDGTLTSSGIGNCHFIGICGKWKVDIVFDSNLDKRLGVFIS